MEPQETPHGQVALRFASQLVAGKFEEAQEEIHDISEEPQVNQKT